MVLQLIRSLPGAPAASAPAPAIPTATPMPPAGPEPTSSPPLPSPGVAGGAVAPNVALVSGRVTLPNVNDEAYVYVEGRGSARPRAVEIEQEGKQFTPSVTVVPVGSRVTFPNADAVFHNVFSRTPGTVFDLGTVKGGETSPPVTLLTPGHVEIFCNIHSKMRADILVVPNGHYTKVRPDGSFALANVPIRQPQAGAVGPAPQAHHAGGGRAPGRYGEAHRRERPHLRPSEQARSGLYLL